MNTTWIAIIVFSIMGLIFGSILTYASRCFIMKKDSVVEQIDKLLPQIQCGQCGYPGCRSYAESIGLRMEEINLCSPGGKSVILKIATLLNVNPIDINSHKNTGKLVSSRAIINELNCIGCMKCIQVCPVNAIVGTKHTMHTVIADLCTGCNLCLALCPTQCIKMHEVKIIPDN